MRQLVRHQRPVRRVEPAALEDDVIPVGEGPGADRFREPRGARVAVNAHVAEVPAEPRLEERALGRAILAGGLNSGNAAAAARLGTYALDVGSGVEAAPGRKDSARMQAFFEALRLPVRADRAAEQASC